MADKDRTDPVSQWTPHRKSWASEILFLLGCTMCRPLHTLWAFEKVISGGKKVHSFGFGLRLGGERAEIFFFFICMLKLSMSADGDNWWLTWKKVTYHGKK